MANWAGSRLANLTLLSLFSAFVILKWSKAQERMEVWKHYISRVLIVLSTAVISKVNLWSLEMEAWEVINCKQDLIYLLWHRKDLEGQALENSLVSTHWSCLWILPIQKSQLQSFRTLENPHIVLPYHLPFWEQRTNSGDIILTDILFPSEIDKVEGSILD